MKFSWASSLVIVLAASEAVGASSWFSKAGKYTSTSSKLLIKPKLIPTVYNKWHETELERWLSDHSTILCPTSWSCLSNRLI